MKQYTQNDIASVAACFVARLQAYLPAEKWEAVQNGDHPNDVCDANQLLIDAYADVFGREPFFPSDAEDGFCSEDAVNNDGDLLDSIWDASAFLRIRLAEWTQWHSALAAAESYGFECDISGENERDFPQAEAKAWVFLRDETAVIELREGILVRDF
jgi:hypothetical protein